MAMQRDGYTDIHAHVLPGLDDGPPDMAASLRLLQAFANRQVSRVFCTSHYLSPHFQVDLAQLAAAYQALQEARATTPVAPRDDLANREAAPTEMVMSDQIAQGQATGLTAQPGYPELAPGAEVRLANGIVDAIREGRVPTLGNTRYVLVEFPSTNIPDEALNWVYELTVRGYQPIMAHPERNLAVQKRPDIIHTLLDAGLLLQLTAACLTTPPERRHKADELAWDILRAGHAAVIASDAHDPHVRAPLLADAYAAVRGELGDVVCEALIANADAIWQGEACQPVPPTPPKRRRFSLPWSRAKQKA
ncbi:MAG: hypothetical protein K6T63_07390 [Alicyclobacillus herbarius]|uniref:tyrosine-protein phosphatase n=1 Tax=Alicyclobacillus herbarius TaxID=122960 RepID=UPI002353AE17|nr:CpsB/CapC family capsule biosynthesis tyrosine phosphatase [Alicyclobacillus herbarius]MCL6632444.1 hypothetical protein [Alicyclobacillus herbarius]